MKRGVFPQFRSRGKPSPLEVQHRPPHLRVLEPFVVGLQLARLEEGAALAVLERVPGAGSGDALGHQLRHLQAWPAKDPYPFVCQDVAELLRKPVLRSQVAAVVVNATGLGMAALERLADADPRLRYVACWITAGDKAQEDDLGWRVPQRELVGAVQTLVDQGRLEIAERLEGRELLMAELEDMEVEAEGTAGRTRFKAGPARNGLLTAAALACWWGEFAVPARTEMVPDPAFNAWDPEALRFEREKRRVKSRAAKPRGPLADGI